MIGESLLFTLPAFVAERAHQWQSLGSRDWLVGARRGRASRRAVLATALVVGWGEGLGFYVQSEHAFWAMIFWVMVAHVILTGSLALRGGSKPLRIAGPLVIAAATGAAMLRCRALDFDRPSSWLGASFVPPLRDDAARWIAGAAFAAMAALLLWSRGRGRPGAAVFPACTVASALLSTFLPGAALGPVVFVLGAHAMPCFARTLLREDPGRRARAALLAAGFAALEWFLAAKSIWFAEGALFPDLVDWWDLGDGADFILHPLWMAPFLAHVVVDAIRYWQTEGAPS